MTVTREQLEQLKKKIPYKYKLQQFKNGKAIIVAYIDARDAMNLLDEVVGPENWQNKFEVINNNLYCHVGIKCGEEWIWKSDCGIESQRDAEKGEASSSFKRACVHWGIGRFLYSTGIIELPTKKYKDKEKVASHEGDILWNVDDITNYINSGKTTKKTSVDSNKESTKSNKYKKPDKEPTYNKTQYSEDTIKRVSKLEVDGVKGKEALSKFITDYNKSNKTSFKKISDFDDKELNKLIDYIEKQPPKDI